MGHSKYQELPAKGNAPSDPAGQLVFAATLAIDLIEITAYGLSKALREHERVSLLAQSVHRYASPFRVFAD